MLLTRDWNAQPSLRQKGHEQLDWVRKKYRLDAPSAESGKAAAVGSTAAPQQEVLPQLCVQCQHIFRIGSAGRRSPGVLSDQRKVESGHLAVHALNASRVWIGRGRKRDLTLQSPIG